VSPQQQQEEEQEKIRMASDMKSVPDPKAGNIPVQENVMHNTCQS